MQITVILSYCVIGKEALETSCASFTKQKHFRFLFPQAPRAYFHLSPNREKNERGICEDKVHSYHCSNVLANMFAEIESHFSGEANTEQFGPVKPPFQRVLVFLFQHSLLRRRSFGSSRNLSSPTLGRQSILLNKIFFSGCGISHG